MLWNDDDELRNSDPPPTINWHALSALAFGIGLVYWLVWLLS